MISSYKKQVQGTQRNREMEGWKQEVEDWAPISVPRIPTSREEQSEAAYLRHARFTMRTF